jgi:hypothetical protein
MLSQSDKAKGVRKYYIVAEGLLRDHFEQIINDLNKELGLVKNNIKKPVEIIGGHIYILKAMNTSQKNMFKLGGIAYRKAVTAFLFSNPNLINRNALHFY